MKTNKPAIVTCRKHWIAFVGPIVVLLIFILLAINAITTGSIGLALGCLIVGVVIAGIWYLCINSEQVVLTDSEIVGKKGVIKSTKLVAPIAKVQGVAVSNGLLGKMLGYHTIVITTAGTAGVEYAYKQMVNAEVLQQKYIDVANS